MTDQPDRVGAALWSILGGSTTGAAACAAALFVWRLLGLTVDALPWILMATLIVAAGTGWTLSRPIADLWRRAVTAAICVFGAALLMLGTIIVDLQAQALGLGVYGVLLTALALLAAGRARRAGRTTA